MIRPGAKFHPVSSNRNNAIGTDRNQQLLNMIRGDFVTIANVDWPQTIIQTARVAEHQSRERIENAISAPSRIRSPKTNHRVARVSRLSGHANQSGNG
jgi:hypothetical protein